MVKQHVITYDDEQRIMLLYRHGKSSREIAEELGFTANAINKKIRDMGLRKKENQVSTYATQEEIDRCLNCDLPVEWCDTHCASRQTKGRV